MRAMRAEEFSGYKGLRLVDLPKPAGTDGRVLLRITTAGVTPLDHTILSGQYLRAKAPLVLGGEEAAVVEEGGGGSDFPVGSRVMFVGPYGVSEDGAYSEWLAVRKENIHSIPETMARSKEEERGERPPRSINYQHDPGDDCIFDGPLEL